MTATLTIAEFLLGRLAEDEAAAEGGGRHPDPTTFARDNYGYLWIDPARVLVDVEAKRRIVELADEATGLDMQVDSEFRVGDRDEASEPYLGDQILRALALPFADHPDYREEWRP